MPPIPRSGTALHGYDRLEAPGLWRPGWQEQRRDVVVSLGEATITLTDRADRPLAHWSLPALRRIADTPPLYALAAAEGAGDPDGETLEIEDPQMNAALDAILGSLAVDPRGGRLRAAIVAAGLVCLVAAVVLGGPDLLRSQALDGLTADQREELGERVVAAMAPEAGAPCDDPFGAAALRALAIAALGEDPPRVWVLANGPAGGGAPVPGGIVLAAATIADAPDAASVGARVAAEAARGVGAEAALMADAELGELARMLVAPEVPDAVLRRHAVRLADLSAPPPAAPDAPAASLPEADWIALRGICDRR